MSTVAWLVASSQLLTAQAGATPVITRQVASESRRDVAVERIVAEHVDSDETVHYQYNRVDLNGDGTPEVLLRIDGPSLCGSGGCPLFVLRKTAGRYEEISRTTLTWAPVVVSEQRTGGWSDLILWQRAYPPGGASYYALLEFESPGYPSNPSMEPARLLEMPVRGVAYLFDREARGLEYRRQRRSRSAK
jgi:hypothetical protein